MTETIGLAVVNEPTIDPAIYKLFHAYGDVFSIDLAVQLAQQVRDDALEAANVEINRLTNAGLQCAYGETMATDEIEHWVKLATEQREVIEDLRGKLKAANIELHELRIRVGSSGERAQP